MLFNSFAFIFLFLPLVLAITKRLKGRALLFTLTAASFVFYIFAGHAWFLIPMLITTLVDFAIAPRLQAAKTVSHRRKLLIFSLCANLGLLIYFKYARMVLSTFGGVPEPFKPYLDVILPAGISFYTFQTLSYIIDVYRGEAKAEKGLWVFTSFVSFFPHLVAGPLTRHNQLIPGLKRIAKNGIQPRWREGFFLFAIGLCKKTLIADRIAGFIDPMLADIPGLGFAGGWLALVGYALQIYFDFSGYSDMAIGLGRLFGIELPQNFNSPYRATDPSDFWKRWHITLSQWLRDYLYISLGGNRGSRARQFLNLMITMVLGGLWHGASWTFAAWGFYHGVLLIAYHSLKKHWDALKWKQGLTFLLICLSWIFFRANSFADAAHWFGAVFGFHGSGAERLGTDQLHLALLISAGLLIAWTLPPASSYAQWKKLPASRQAALGAATALAIVFMNFSSKFLYYQF